MLVLTRKKDEIIRIGDNTKLIILDITHKQVRIGVIAPTEIEVHREEIYQRIQAENKGAKPCKLEREKLSMIKPALTYRPASEMPENKKVLLYSPEGGFFIGYKYMGKIEVFPRDSRFDKLNFSHYLELPEPPKESI